MSFTSKVSPVKFTSLYDTISVSKFVSNLPPTSILVAAYLKGWPYMKGIAYVKLKPESITKQTSD